MKIGIIGAGFVGLSAAYKLSKDGHQVTVFESDNQPGGLASGFVMNRWEWALERHYHHWFTNDQTVLQLAREIDFPVITRRPKTSVIVKGKIHQFDSPMTLFSFPHLSLIDKVKTGFLLVFLKAVPFWSYLERVTAKEFLIKYGGRSAWQMLWGPLFEGKFGKYSGKIPAIWFWARIKKRTPSLVYTVGGFRTFAACIDESIHRYKGKTLYNSKVGSIEKRKDGKITLTINGNKKLFDKVICTLSTPLFIKITRDLPEDYVRELKSLKGLGAITLVLSLKTKYFSNGTYWLNINEKGFPFLAVVEHTNMIDKKHYGNENILYIGSYLERGHAYFSKSENELIEEYFPSLRRIAPNFKRSWIVDKHLFKIPFAQPIIPLNYSQQIPSLETPVKGLYLANIQQVYPWDRGTNYAVELGYKVADLVIESK